jgi:hypothetical protein
MDDFTYEQAGKLAKIYDVKLSMRQTEAGRVFGYTVVSDRGKWDFHIISELEAFFAGWEAGGHSWVSMALTVARMSERSGVVSNGI